MRLSTGGVFDDVGQLSQAIQAVGEKYNLIVPGGAIGTNLPLLYAAGVSFVFIDPINETYAIPGKSARGIGKNALDRISSAAGVRWDPYLCGRLDDGKNQNVVEYQAAGTVLQLDGTERMIHASKRIDLRADRNTPTETWGNDAQEFARSAAAKKDDKGEPGDPWIRILQARQHILSLAESKAKSRAIRSLGVRTAYEPAELAKGFAIVRLQFTGRSEDPEIEHEVALMIAQRALSSSSALYGRRGIARAETPALHAPRAVARLVAPEEPEDEQEDPKKEGPDPAGESKSTAAAAPASVPAAAPAAAPPQPKSDPMLICGEKDPDGNWPRKPCSALTVEELEKKIAAYKKKKPEWEKKWAAKNQAELDALCEWLDYRNLNQGKLNLGAAAPKSTNDVVPF
jgi:hypothetical protein